MKLGINIMKAKGRNETGHQYFESKGVGLKLGIIIMKGKGRNETGQ